MGNEVVEQHHAAALALEPVVLCLTLDGVPDEELVAEVLVEDDVAQGVGADSADEEAPREDLAVEVLLEQYVGELVFRWLKLLPAR
jgi:hypothetical protein